MQTFEIENIGFNPMNDLPDDKDEESNPPWKNRNAWIAILCGAILLFISYYTFEEKENSPYAAKFPHDATHEIGFALVVAVLIWAIFEVASRKETERSWSKRIDRITKNVFFGVLGNNLSREFINEARIVAIEHDFERRDFHVTYRMAEQSYDNGQGRAVEFVAMRATGVFKIVNISTKKKNYCVAVGLPNPFIDEMKKYCVIHRAAVSDSKGMTELNVDPVNKLLQERLKDDRLYNVECPIEDIGMMPGEEIGVSIEYTVAKEAEDTEIVQTLYPTNSIVININDMSSPKRAIQARSIHRVPITTDASGAADGCYVFRMSTPLLPYQGFAIFWKKVPVRTPAPLLLSND